MTLIEGETIIRRPFGEVSDSLSDTTHGASGV